MAKLKIIIDDIRFLLKDIKTIIISDVIYNKKDYSTTVDIQKFYLFIIDNKKDISYIKTNNGLNYRIKNSKIHCDYSYAMFRDDLKFHLYYLNGILYRKKDWLKSPEHKSYILKQKLNNINNDNRNTV